MATRVSILHTGCRQMSDALTEVALAITLTPQLALARNNNHTSQSHSAHTFRALRKNRRPQYMTTGVLKASSTSSSPGKVQQLMPMTNTGNVKNELMSCHQAKYADL